MIGNSFSAALLTLAMLGFGFAAARVAFRELAVDQCLAAGVCLFLALCGVLEVCAAASVAVFRIILLAGIAGGAIVLTRWHPRLSLKAWWIGASPAARRGLWITGVLCALFILQSLFWDFHITDDVRGYLILPFRILQEGNASQDPFLYRRIEAGLGVGQYLYAALLSVGDFTALKFADLGLGIAIIALSVTDICGKRPRFWLPVTLGITLFLIALSPNFNLSPDTLGVALCLVLSGIIFSERIPAGARRGVLAGFFVFTIVGLKTTYVMPAATILFAGYGAGLAGDKKKVTLIEAGVAAATALILMLPWMYTTWKLAGTPLFPFLGYGILSHDEFVHRFSWQSIEADVVRSALALALPLALLAATARKGKTKEIRARATLLVGATLALMVGLVFVTSIFYFRYAYPEIALVSLLACCSSATAELRWRPWMTATLVLSLVGVASNFKHGGMPNLNEGWYVTLARESYIGKWIKDPNRSERLLVTRDRQDYAQGIGKLQAAMPPGSSGVAEVDAAMFFDFHRNKIYVMDWPGMTSPAPGLPRTDQPSAWRSYFRARHIRYVLYSRKDGLVRLETLSPDARDRLMASPWQASLTKNYERLHAVFASLHTVCPQVWSDGARTALDCK